MENLEKLTKELELDQDKIKPIEGQGFFAYRKYLWAIKFIEEKILRLQTYRQEIVKDVDSEMAKQAGNIDRIKGEIEKAIINDPIANKTKTGGRNLVLPDIATVSLSKLKETIQILDPEMVLDELGQEFKKVKVSLDTTKAKNHMKETGVISEGATKKENRTLSIRFKR